MINILTGRVKSGTGRSNGGVTLATLSARKFTQDVSSAERAGIDGPVIITDRGRPAFVLLAIEDYRWLAGAPTSPVSRLAMDDDEVEFEPEPADLTLRVPDL